MLRVVEGGGELPERANAEALADLDSLRQDLLVGRITEFCWVGVTDTEEIVTCVPATRNAMLRLAGVSRLLHRLQTTADQHTVSERT